MSFTYDIALSASRDILRFLVQDTSLTTYVYEDEELDGLIALEPNLYQAAALALRAKLPQYIQRAISYSIGTTGNGILAINRKDIPKYFMGLIENYEEKAMSVPEEYLDSFDYSIDAYGRDMSQYITDLGTE